MHLIDSIWIFCFILWYVRLYARRLYFLRPKLSSWSQPYWIRLDREHEQRETLSWLSCLSCTMRATVYTRIISVRCRELCHFGTRAASQATRVRVVFLLVFVRGRQYLLANSQCFAKLPPSQQLSWIRSYFHFFPLPFLNFPRQTLFELPAFVTWHLLTAGFLKCARVKLVFR